MPKATGSIHYIEHRSPMKDETGEYLIHPQFVYSDIYDFKDMTKGMRHHHQMTPAQFVAAIESIKDETMLALSQGMEVKIGNMLVIRPKLKLREHKDEMVIIITRFIMKVSAYLPVRWYVPVLRCEPPRSLTRTFS